VKQRLGVVQGGAPSIFEDLEALKIEPDENEGSEANLQRIEEEAWQRGSFAIVPKLWHDRLKEIRASGDLHRLAWTLLYRANLEPRFPVTSRTLFAAGVARQHKRSLLERLEFAGLVRVEWRPAPQVPWVTVLRRAGRRGRHK
jgi:hypothetical protein